MACTEEMPDPNVAGLRLPSVMRWRARWGNYPPYSRSQPVPDAKYSARKGNRSGIAVSRRHQQMQRPLRIRVLPLVKPLDETLSLSTATRMPIVAGTLRHW